jgi:hypothetical protein
MEDSIKRFNDWKNMWSDPSQMGIMNYISFNVHPEDVLILGYLFFPKFIEFDGCLFFKDNFSERNYSLWKEKLGDDRSSIEKVMNHVHVYDIFANCTDKVPDSVFEKVGKLLQFCWSIYLHHEFPNKSVIVSYINDENDYGPTLYIYQE